jgi:hypothetical protein
MQRSLDLLVIRLTQWRARAVIDNPIQFFQIHFDLPPCRLLPHN